MLKLLKTVIITLLFFKISTTIAQEQKYPPYPDVWGYDLTEFQTGKYEKYQTSYIYAFKSDDGDIWFIPALVIKEDSPKPELIKILDEKFVLIKFFSGQKEEISKGEFLRLFSYARDHNKTFDLIYNVKFNDGSSIEKKSETTGKYCRFDELRFKSLIKRGKNGKEVDRVSIIAADQNIKKIEDHTDPTCLINSTEYVFKQLKFLALRLIKLKDDTFITFRSDCNLIVRLDKDFRTKFKPQTKVKTRDGRELNTNLFIVPYSIIEDIYFEAEQRDAPSYEQYLHDGLIDYFIKKQNKQNFKR